MAKSLLEERCCVCGTCGVAGESCLELCRSVINQLLHCTTAIVNSLCNTGGRFRTRCFALFPTCRVLYESKPPSQIMGLCFATPLVHRSVLIPQLWIPVGWLLCLVGVWWSVIADCAASLWVKALLLNILSLLSLYKEKEPSAYFLLFFFSSVCLLFFFTFSHVIACTSASSVLSSLHACQLLPLLLLLLRSEKVGNVQIGTALSPVAVSLRINSKSAHCTPSSAFACFHTFLRKTPWHSPADCSFPCISFIHRIASTQHLPVSNHQRHQERVC